MKLSGSSSKSEFENYVEGKNINARRAFKLLVSEILRKVKSTVNISKDTKRDDAVNSANNREIAILLYAVAEDKFDLLTLPDSIYKVIVNSSSALFVQSLGL